MQLDMKYNSSILKPSAHRYERLFKANNKKQLCKTTLTYNLSKWHELTSLISVFPRLTCITPQSDDNTNDHQAFISSLQNVQEGRNTCQRRITKCQMLIRILYYMYSYLKYNS